MRGMAKVMHEQKTLMLKCRAQGSSYMMNKKNMLTKTHRILLKTLLQEEMPAFWFSNAHTDCSSSLS